MKKGSISLDEYLKAIKRLETMLLEANELLRSAYAIAQRNGEQTNWEAFRGQLKKALDAQHESGLTKRAPDVCPADGGKHSWHPNKDNYLIYSCRKCGARG